MSGLKRQELRGPTSGHATAARLDRVTPVNEQHLRSVLAEYVAYYNTERPHRSLALEPPLPAVRSPVACGAVKSRAVLGGLHHVYHRAA